MPPIVSQIVKDRKMFGELKIVDISENKAPFEGGKKIFLFCSKVQRSDIEIHFQFGNDSDNGLVIAPDTSEVHEQYGIKFTSPKCSFSIDNTRVQARVQVCKLWLSGLWSWQAGEGYKITLITCFVFGFEKKV